MKSNLKRVIALIISLLIFVTLIPSAATSSAKLSRIKKIRFWSYDEYTRVVVELSAPVIYSKDTLKNPLRLYLNLRKTSIKGFGKSSIDIKDGILKKIRIGQYDRTTARVVLDLDNFNEYKVFSLANPDRIVIDVFGNEDTGNEEKKKKKFEPVKNRLVIDPGHGGKDPGAVGHYGLKEKDVTLDISLKLARILREKYLYDVQLTREDDRFIPLDERTLMANREKADIFVSIHANANSSKKVRGVETYFLNWTNDKEAIKVAARENSISENQMHQVQTELGSILVSLARESKRNQSLRLAHYIQDSIITRLSDSFKDINDLGVKQALFYVLIGASMPSVLVEVAFMTNPYEERLLTDEKYKTNLAYSIAKGISIYMSTLPEDTRFAEVKQLAKDNE